MAIDRFGQSEGVENWSRKIHDIMDEMLNRTFVDFRDARAWQPAINVYETREAYFICVELAGVNEDEIDVECVDATRVVIRGRRAQPRPAGPDTILSVYVMEIDEGPFRREIELAQPVDVDAVQAAYTEGYLWITLPRTTRE